MPAPLTPSGLRLRRVGDDTIEIEGRFSREGPLLVAIALGALAVTPVIAPGGLTPLRVTTFLALSALASFIGFGAVGRRRRVVIRPKTGELEADGRRHALSAGRALWLTTTGGVQDAEPRIGYRVELELGDARRVTLLEGSDPAAVLADLRELLAYFTLPVRRGWQIPVTATPWLEPRTDGGAEIGELDLSTPPLPSQRRAAITVLCGAVFTTVAMSVMFGTRLKRGAPIAPLSWALALGTILLLYLIGLNVLTERVVVKRVGDSLRVERRALGRTRSVWQLPLSDFRRAYPVGPSVDDTRHVLIESSSGLRAIPCSGQAAAELAQALGGSSEL